jgi:hypothetical protein
MSLGVLSDGRLASASRDHMVRVWRQSNIGFELESVLKGHEATVTYLAALSGGRIASVSEDRSSRIWEESGGRWQATRVQKLPGIAHAVVQRRDGAGLICGGAFGVAMLSDGLGLEQHATTNGVVAVTSIAGEKKTFVTPIDRDTTWQTATVRGRKVPADERYHRYTYYVTDAGRLLPAYEFPELIEWDDPDKPRTLILRWPGQTTSDVKPGA